MMFSRRAFLQSLSACGAITALPIDIAKMVDQEKDATPLLATIGTDKATVLDWEYYCEPIHITDIQGRRYIPGPRWHKAHLRYDGFMNIQIRDEFHMKVDVFDRTVTGHFMAQAVTHNLIENTTDIIAISHSAIEIVQ